MTPPTIASDHAATLPPQIIIDDEAFNRLTFKASTVFCALLGAVVTWQVTDYPIAWISWNTLMPAFLVWMLVLQRLTVLYFNRDQKRDAALGELRRSRFETFLELAWLFAYPTLLLIWNASFSRGEDAPLSSYLAMPLLTAIIALYFTPFVIRDIRHLMVGERVLRFSSTGFELPELHDGPILWHDIKSLHLGQRVVIQLHEPAKGAKPRRFWERWGNFGSWSDDKTLLRFANVQFGAGAREVAAAFSARVKALTGPAI